MAIRMSSKHKLHAVLIICVIANITVWQFSHRKQAFWPNVPLPPSELNVSSSFLGDKALAYRVWALALQNYGNAGGNYQPLKDYNYTHLGLWFDLLDRLDHKSDFVPYLAGYYYGSTQNPVEQLPPVVAYLEKVGTRPEREKWRWLAHAVYLARHPMKNPPEALRLAKELREQFRPGMPAWVLQMEGMIASDQGDKQAAYNLMIALLSTEAEHMQAQEINFMVDYICTRILTEVQAMADPLCSSPEARAGNSRSQYIKQK